MGSLGAEEEVQVTEQGVVRRCPSRGESDRRALVGRVSLKETRAVDKSR